MFPALRIDGKVIKGQANDSHMTISTEHPNPPDSARGFVVGGQFLTRKQALGFLKTNDPETYRKLPKEALRIGLHSEFLAKALGIKQKPLAVEIIAEAKDEHKEAPKPVDLSKMTVVIYDRGLYTYMAEFLARFYGKVKYYRHDSEIYPQGAQCQVGKGIPGVEWIDDFWGNIDDADVIFFPYVFDGKVQDYLRGKGYPVCGSGTSERIEHDKLFLKKELKKLGMPVAPHYEATGLDDLESFLEGKKEKYVVKSIEAYRGDWETTSYKNAFAFKSYVNNVRQHVGPERAKEMKFIVESWVESECETGCDGFMLGGELAPWPTIGFEVKDEGYIARAVKHLPEIIQDGMTRMIPLYKSLGGQGTPYSNENRITKEGTTFRTDDTLRCGNPPTCTMIEMYGEQYAHAIYCLAHNQMPEMKKPDFEYGAEIVLQSVWYIKNELHVGCPKDFGKYIKLNNMYIRDGQRYCDPVLSQDDVSYFGSIVGVGHTLKEATEMALEKIKELDVYKLNYCENIFDQCGEVLKVGAKFGVVL